MTLVELALYLIRVCIALAVFTSFVLAGGCVLAWFESKENV